MTQFGTYDELITSSPSFSHLLEDIHQQEQEIHLQIEKQQSIISSIYSEKDNDDETIPQIDTKQEGAIKWNVYVSYVKAGLGCAGGFIFVILIYTAHQTVSMYSSWWLAKWTNDESHRYQNFTTCTSNLSANINHVRSMPDDQWSNYRNERFYVYCGEFVEIAILTAFFNEF